MDITPSGWFSTVGPAGLRTDRQKMIRWIILGRGQAGGKLRPPDYEFSFEISTGLHRFVSLCTSISYFTLNVKDYIV